MKLTEIRDLSTPELEKKLNDTREELMKLRFQLASGSLKDYTRLRFTRRIIAKLMTVIHDREAVEGRGES